MSNDAPINPHAAAMQAQDRMKRGISETTKKIDAILGPDRMTLQEAVAVVAGADPSQVRRHAPGGAAGIFDDPALSARYDRFTQNMRPVVLEDAKFKIITVLKEAGGKEIDMWQVRDDRNEKIGPVMRREDDARMLAAILNETNNKNDPRALAIINLVSQENNLLSQRSRTLREAKTTSNPAQKRSLTEQAESLKGQILQVRGKLGV